MNFPLVSYIYLVNYPHHCNYRYSVILKVINKSLQFIIFIMNFNMQFLQLERGLTRLVGKMHLFAIFAHEQPKTIYPHEYRRHRK